MFAIARRYHHCVLDTWIQQSGLRSDFVYANNPSGLLEPGQASQLGVGSLNKLHSS